MKAFFSSRALSAIAFSAAVTAALGALVGYAGAHLIRIPRVEELATYRPDIITEIRAADGTTIARYAVERRILIPASEIPVVLKRAIVATEDKNFYRHGGIDVVRIASAGTKDFLLRRYAEGASTLTQQLARAVFLTPQKSLSRKINEALLAVEIERRFSKDQILALYCNQIYLGHGNYGVEAAARYYFGIPAAKLSISQAALLAGLIQRPEEFSPFRNPDKALSRRAHVLRRMAEERAITPGQAAAARRWNRFRNLRQAESVVALLCQDIPAGISRRRITREGTSIAAASGSIRRSTRSSRVSRRKPSAGACAGSSGRTSLQAPKRHRRGVRRPERHEDPLDPGGADGLRFGSRSSSPWRGVRRSSGSAAGGNPSCPRPSPGPAPPRSRRTCGAGPDRRVGRKGRAREERDRRRSAAAGRGGGADLRERDRGGAGHGRRLRLGRVEVQPRGAGVPPDRVVLQALRLSDGARKRVHPVGHPLRRTHLDRDRSPPASLPAAQLPQRLCRDRHDPPRPRALDQHPGRQDGPDGGSEERGRDGAPVRDPGAAPRLPVDRARRFRNDVVGDDDRVQHASPTRVPDPAPIRSRASPIRRETSWRRTAPTRRRSLRPRSASSSSGCSKA